MEYKLITTYFTGQKSLIEKYGDKIWEAVCDEIPEDGFKREDVAAVIKRVLGVKETVAKVYARAFVKNCLMMESGGLREIGPRTLRFHNP